MHNRNITLRLAVSAFALVALSAGAAFAQGPGGGMMDRVAAMDTNHDGAISPAEQTAGREAQFAHLDANHDGFITQDEIPQRPEGAPAGGPPGGGPPGGGGPGGGVMFQHADTDGDGKISHAEFMAQPSRLARIDTNNDGTISAAELAAARAAFAARSGGN